MKRTLIYLVITLCCSSVFAASVEQADSVVTARKPNLLQRVVGYAVGNEIDTSTVNALRPKLMALGGPYYSTDAKLGMVLAGMLSFRMKGSDPRSQASNLMLFSGISTAGFWQVGISGAVLFPRDKRRINADLLFNYSPIHFWGIGYAMADNDSNEGHLHQQELRCEADYVLRVAPHLYVGPALALNRVRCSHIDRPELLNGQDRLLRNYGVGFSLHYDTRDQITNATSGFYLSLRQLFRPSWLGNHYAFSTTSFSASARQSLWEGGVVAGEVRGVFNFGNPSWAMLAQLGGNDNMRGYYNGRYRDKHLMTAQVEVRQHVWKRSGLAAWLGVGTAFHDAISFGNLLPNYGIGYRFHLRKTLVLRLDYGFGKVHQNGFVMSVNEAF